jgi:hydroxymethylpyrimidine/phosphomethylpyrimidine kinase
VGWWGAPAMSAAESVRSGRGASGTRKFVPRVLLVGGLESSSRVGLLADAEAVRARGGVPLLVATAVTAQGGKTFAWRPVAPALVGAQIRAVRALGPVHAVKVGMVPSRAQAEAVRRALRGLKVPLVVDPVVRASSGGKLSTLQPSDYRGLARDCVWLTPNTVEATWLFGGGGPVRGRGESRQLAEHLCALGFAGVVVKGGHLPGSQVVDVLATGRRVEVFRGARLRRHPSQRGTGCRFASALATELGRGRGAVSAVRRARALVRRFLRGG